MTRKLWSIIMMLVAVWSTTHAQLLYEVSGNGLTSPSYLFGTHHLAPISILDSVSEALPALERSQCVVGEIDMLHLDAMAMAMKMRPYMMAPADSTLHAVMGDSIYKVSQQRYRDLCGMDLALFDSMRPIVAQTVAATTLINRELPGYNPEEQLDMYLQRLGESSGKEIVPLEKAEEQAAILYATLPISSQVQGLLDMLDNPQEQIDNVRKLNAAYMARDLQMLQEISTAEESDPAFMEALLQRRNAAWMKALPPLMHDKPAFVAVGALHLTGPDGLVERLRTEGYKVKPLP